MVMLDLNDRDGQKVRQTISVNEQENIAAIFVSSKNYSATTLYDYRKNLIGIRTINSNVCCVLRMDRSQIPSIQDMLTLMDNAKNNNPSSDDEITYRVTLEQAANPVDVGMSVNLLCSNVDIYWAKMESPRDVRRFKLKKPSWLKKPKWSVVANIAIPFG
ncbi:gastrokine-2-like [Dendropsophus ebraccatus]|uniref:gastrokine-2-like n=1 Tax=Dendropsophus ebraccatus TaxID=150705 RepID=UPI003831CE28